MTPHLRPCDLYGAAQGETLDDAIFPPGLGSGDIRLARRLPILSDNGCGVGGDCFYCSHELAAGDGTDESGRLHADQRSDHGFRNRPSRAQDLRHRLGASRRPCIPIQWLTSVGDGLDPEWHWRQLDVGVFTTGGFACPPRKYHGLGQSRDSRHEPSPSGGNSMPVLGAAPHSPRLLGSIGGWFRSTQYSPSCRMDSVNCSKSTGFTM
jgi:hypothetical protein